VDGELIVRQDQEGFNALVDRIFTTE